MRTETRRIETILPRPSPKEIRKRWKLVDDLGLDRVHSMHARRHTLDDEIRQKNKDIKRTFERAIGIKEPLED